LDQDPNEGQGWSWEDYEWLSNDIEKLK
jgi:hypothetical protein